MDYREMNRGMHVLSILLVYFLISLSCSHLHIHSAFVERTRCNRELSGFMAQNDRASSGFRGSKLVPDLNKENKKQKKEYGKTEIYPRAASMVGLNYFALFARRRWIRIKLTSWREDFEPREDQTQSEVAKWRTRTGENKDEVDWLFPWFAGLAGRMEKNYDRVLLLRSAPGARKRREFN